MSKVAGPTASNGQHDSGLCLWRSESRIPSPDRRLGHERAPSREGQGLAKDVVRWVGALVLMSAAFGFFPKPPRLRRPTASTHLDRSLKDGPHRSFEQAGIRGPL